MGYVGRYRHTHSAGRRVIRRPCCFWLRDSAVMRLCRRWHSYTALSRTVRPMNRNACSTTRANFQSTDLSTTALRNSAAIAAAVIDTATPRRIVQRAHADTHARPRPIAPGTPNAHSPSYSNFDAQGDHIMPYLLGWLLGVPLIVLVILYLIFH
jgi:hypothetical protein